MPGLGVGQINNYAAGGATTLFGLHQYFEGKKMEKNNKRPTYEIPPEIQQNLNQAQQQALQGLPEEQKQQYISNLQRSSAYGMSQLGSRNAGIAGVAAMNENQNQGYSNLLAQDSAARMQNQQQLYGARQNMADYKDQAFQFNKVDPFYELQARAEAMKGAGIQNIGNSFQIAGGGQGSGANPNQGAQSNTPQVRSMSTNNNANPYAVNTYNTYQNPNLFNQNPYGNPYGNNAGTYMNPNQNMFDRPNANPNNPL